MVSIHPPWVQRFVTRIAIKMHSTPEKWIVSIELFIASIALYTLVGETSVDS